MADTLDRLAAHHSPGAAAPDEVGPAKRPAPGPSNTARALFIVPPPNGRPAWWDESVPHRAIGVVYGPEGDRFRNYVRTEPGRRYDAFLWLDRTTAPHPLHESQRAIRSRRPTRARSDPRRPTGSARRCATAGCRAGRRRP
ncbi:erythromycin esterase family protein [Actinocorallia sp. API 0066]|uniref:erythromycin esterase family protein n=1 Tax=Actinocorallia sp. API 0066 TaxID=2896846 RepID=UPI0035ABA806